MAELVSVEEASVRALVMLDVNGRQEERTQKISSVTGYHCSAIAAHSSGHCKYYTTCIHYPSWDPEAAGMKDNRNMTKAISSLHETFGFLPRIQYGNRGILLCARYEF